MGWMFVPIDLRMSETVRILFEAVWPSVAFAGEFPPHTEVPPPDE